MNYITALTAQCNPECANGGTCSNDHQCVCLVGWIGEGCTQGSCSKYDPHNIMLEHVSAVCPDGCANNGTCMQPGLCQCTHQWEGHDCTQGMGHQCIVNTSLDIFPLNSQLFAALPVLMGSAQTQTCVPVWRAGLALHALKVG